MKLALKAHFTALFILTFALGWGGCGLEGEGAGSQSRARSAPVSATLAAKLPTGNWLEAACNEGPSGPDLPPPPYLKGIIRFEARAMRWSSQIYDDKDCTALRPHPIEEIVVAFVVPEKPETTDGSVPIDMQIPEHNGYVGYPMFGLLKVVDGKLLFALYSTAAGRPKAMDPSQAQILAPM